MLSDSDKLLFTLDKKMRLAITRYGLIEEGDKILVALSGGKDSLALVTLLGRRMRIFNPRFSLVAVHVSMTNVPYISDTTYLEEHCSRVGVPFIHHLTSFDPSQDKRKSPCFLCSWYRRKALFEIAKREGCNKIAFGHHQDDILQTLLMNLTFQGAFSTMPPLLKLDKFAMTLIRPLALITENELAVLASLHNYLPQKKRCPYESSSFRPEMKEVIALLEKMNPQMRQSLWNSMNNIQTQYLPQRVGRQENKKAE